MILTDKNKPRLVLLPGLDYLSNACRSHAFPTVTKYSSLTVQFIGSKVLTFNTANQHITLSQYSHYWVTGHITPTLRSSQVLLTTTAEKLRGQVQLVSQTSAQPSV